MKYSKRELKMFNIFALLLLGIGGLFFVFGGIEFVFQPTTSYTVVRPSRAVTADDQPVADSTDLGAEVKPSRIPQETQEMEGVNLKAVSKALLGVVFIMLSFALNVVLLRVIRRDGQDAQRVPKSD